MEKLIESIPITKVVGVEKDGKEIISGFCIRYSVQEKMWLAGYGRGLRKQNNDFVGVGYSIIEAVDDFIKRCLKK